MTIRRQPRLVCTTVISAIPAQSGPWQRRRPRAGFFIDQAVCGDIGRDIFVKLRR
jgi:hypothetical protein